VRHHGGAEDPGGQVQRARAVCARYEAAQRGGSRRADPERLVEEAGDDEAEQRCDRQLERPVAAGLQPKDAEGDDAGDQPGGQQRDSEQQVQPERGANKLGNVSTFPPS